MAINPLLLSLGMTAGTAGGAQQQPQQLVTPQMQAPQMQAAQAQPNTLAEMTRLLGGDLSGSLSTGDKLLALSGLLRSATRSGRRAGLTPQQVIGDLQQRKLAELQARQQVETLRQSYEQKQRDAAFVAQELPNLPEDQARALSNMDATAAAEQIRQIRFRQRQAMWRDRDPETGRERITFGDGTSVLTEFTMPQELAVAEYDVNGDGVRDRVIVDAQSKQPIEIDGQIQFDQLGVTPSQRQAHLDRVAAEAGRNRRASASGGGGGNLNAPTTIYVTDPADPTKTIPVRAQFNKTTNMYINYNTGEVIPRNQVQAAAGGNSPISVIRPGQTRFPQ